MTVMAVKRTYEPADRETADAAIRAAVQRLSVSAYRTSDLMASVEKAPPPKRRRTRKADK